MPCDELAPIRPRAGSLVHNTPVLRRAHGCLLGQLTGDALGALVEFSTAERISRHYPDGGPRALASGGPHHIMAGQPTDDSELALMLGRTLARLGTFDQEATAGAYARWFHGWTHSELPQGCRHSGCQPFDVGTTTTQALAGITPALAQHGGAAATAIAVANRHSQTNGALMRVSPLGIWGAFREPTDVAAAARQDARLTHPHPVCQDASAVFAVTIAAAIRAALAPAQAYEYAREWGHAAALEPAVLAAIENARSGPPRDFQTQQGWVLVALQNAFHRLCQAKGLKAGVVDTVRRGGDTDTNAAICGALLGAVCGRESVPDQWQRMVLSCRPLVGHPSRTQPRPAIFWPVDALVLAERLVAGP